MCVCVCKFPAEACQSWLHLFSMEFLSFCDTGILSFYRLILHFIGKLENHQCGSQHSVCCYILGSEFWFCWCCSIDSISIEMSTFHTNAFGNSVAYLIPVLKLITSTNRFYQKPNKKDLFRKKTVEMFRGIERWCVFIFTYPEYFLLQ